jgi:phosphatidylglycerol lysyltransferase
VVVDPAAVTHRERARELVVKYGWNSTAYQILNPGIEYWFSSAWPAMAAYVRRGNMIVVAGSPICVDGALPEVCREFEQFARMQGCRVCYVCAEERLLAALESSGRHAAIAMGAQPVWAPSHWPQIVRERASLRAQFSRARNKGIEIEEIESVSAAHDPNLRRVLEDWIRGRRLPPLHFLVEPNVLDGELVDRKVLVARRDGKAIAFLVASPVPARNGYLVELLARSGEAPNGTSELLIDDAMARFAAAGCEYVTLGLVALAHASDDAIARHPLWLRAMMRFARAHANRFYNFRGLERFRLKMGPERWETIYAVSNEPRFSLRTLYSIGGAFAGISPWRAIAIGLGKAIGDEARTLTRPKRTG